MVLMILNIILGLGVHIQTEVKFCKSNIYWNAKMAEQKILGLLLQKGMKVGRGI
jgi:hypothetical protein